MAGFQNTLQGGQATTSSMPKISNTGGIDAATAVVGLAGKAIGANYATAQVENSYQNAFQQYRTASSARESLDDQLRKVTKDYAATGSKELNIQMSRLEEIKRKADMGEAGGVLSGLAAKSRVDAAYKQALSKYPAFASELRAHRDAITSGGAIGAAIATSELRKDQAIADYERTSKAMAEYGLSYNNEDERTTFLAYTRELGGYKAKYDEWMARTAVGRQQQADASKEQTYRFAQNSEGRSQRTAELAEGASYRAQESHDRSGEKHANWRGRLPTVNAQADATLEKTRGDIERTNQTIAYNKVTQPMTVAAKTMDYNTKVNTNKLMADWANLGDSTYGDDFAKITKLSLDGKYTPDQLKAYTLTAMQSAKANFMALAQKHGVVGTPQYNSQMQDIQDNYNSLVSITESGDPMKTKQRQLALGKLERDLDLMEDPSYKRAYWLKATGTAPVLETYSRMRAEAINMPRGDARNRAVGEANSYLEMHNITAPQAMKWLQTSLETGQSVNEATGLILGATVKEGNVDADTDGGKATLKAAMSDTRWGSSAMANMGAVTSIRKAKDPTAKVMYKNAFDDKFDQAAALLPNGYSLEYADRGWKISKKDLAEGEKDFNMVFLPRGDTANPNPSWNMWPSEFSSVSRDDLVGSMRNLDWMVNNASDLVPPNGSKTNGGRMNKNYLGVTADLGRAVAPAVSNAVDVVTSSPAKEYVDAFTQRAQSGGGFLGYTGPRDSQYMDAWDARGKEYQPLYEEAGAAHGVDVDVLIRQGAQESLFKNDTASPKGAVGISQFIPATARAYGLIDGDNDYRNDPAKSIDAQARLMADLLESNDGDMAAALVEYNGGWKMRDAWKAGKIKLKGSNYKESRGYILNILGESAFKG